MRELPKGFKYLDNGDVMRKTEAGADVWSYDFFWKLRDGMARIVEKYQQRLKTIE